jgi:hypothetical protein
MILKQTILDLINTNIRNKLPKVIKSEHANVEEALLDAIFIPFEVKELDCPQQFIDDNFDLTPGSTMGLGKNIMLGFAMCNGNNGTQDRRKRTSVGYDPTAYVSGHDYSIIGNFGGSEDAVLVEHSHDIDIYNSDITGTKVADASGAKSGTVATSNEGESGVGKNMQPFIVTLFIQRV